MSLFRSHTGSFKACRPPSDHKNFLGRCCFLKTVSPSFKFTSGGWIDQAGDPVVTVTPSPAHLVAGKAGPNIFRPSLLCLIGEVRIGYLSADDGNQISLIGSKHRFRIFRGTDMPFHGHQGMPNSTFQGL